MKSPNFEPETELTSDLEWMLQSNQVSREILVEALVGEYYALLYHLSLVFLNDPQAAQQSTSEALGIAVTNAYRYRGQVSVPAWLAQFTLEACRRERLRSQNRQAWRFLYGGQPPAPDLPTPQSALDQAVWQAVDRWDLKDRLIFCLHELHNWTPDEISQALDCSLDQVSASLQSTHISLLPVIPPEDKYASNSIDRDALISLILYRRWPPLIDIFPEATLDRMGQVTQRADAKSSWRQRFSYLRETVMIVLMVLLLVGLVWGVNAIAPNPQATVVPHRTVVVTRYVYITQEARYSTPTQKPTPLATSTQAPTDVFYIVQQDETYPLVAKRLGVSAEELREFNRIPLGVPLQPGQRLLIPGKLNSESPGATPVTLPGRLEPLEYPYDSKAVRERIKLSSLLFNTIWFDAHMIDFGPRGYIGPPKVERIQAWLSQSQSLILAGQLHSLPSEAWLNQDFKLYFAQPSEDQPWFFSWDMTKNHFTPLMEQASYLIQVLLDGDLEFMKGSSLKVIGRDIWVGVQVLLIEQYSQDGVLQERIWLDDRTGVALRKQWFTVDGELAREAAMRDVIYDTDFPQEYFDPNIPWRGGYAADVQGSPIPEYAESWPPAVGRAWLDFILAPTGFDPSQSKLDIQYPPSFDAHKQMESIVSLFGDGYYLGSIFFGNPWSMICQRSPNGMQIAYVSVPAKSIMQNTQLRWFDLGDSPDYVHGLMTPIAVTQFAWAPDSHRLAVFGFPNNLPTGSLMLVDTESSSVESLLRLGDANSLVWSPKGDQIALVARYDPSSYNEYIVVIDANTGEVQYSEPVDFANYAEDWPLLDWGVDFPVNMGGLADCVLPPQ